MYENTFNPITFIAGKKRVTETNYIRMDLGFVAILFSALFIVFEFRWRKS
jgi:hypothetical protein